MTKTIIGKRFLILTAIGVAVTGLFFAPHSAQAVNLCVSATDVTCFTTVQGAVSAAFSGDTITVHAGTYNETVTIDLDYLTIKGKKKAIPVITGGLVLDGVTGLVLKELQVQGDAGSNRIVRMVGVITDLKIDKCIFDGEEVVDRHGFASGTFAGDLTVQKSEFKNIWGWALFESNSGGVPSEALTNVNFSKNYIHDSKGAVAIRGLPGTPTTMVTVHDNVWERINDSLGSATGAWAAIEVNRAMKVSIIGNDISGVQENSWGEGQALQLWAIGDLNVHHNELLDNHQGIWLVYGNSKFGPAPTGKIHSNSIAGNTLNAGSFGLNYQQVESVYSGTVNAECNWWGAADGPSGDGPGSGDTVTGDVDFDPWAEKESGGCGKGKKKKKKKK